LTAVTTLPVTEPDGCATSGEASSELTTNAAMKPVTGAMRLKTK
jgi:hypothetical protein